MPWIASTRWVPRAVSAATDSVTLRRTVGSIATSHRHISKQIASTHAVMIVLTMNMIGRKNTRTKESSRVPNSCPVRKLRTL